MLGQVNPTPYDLYFPLFGIQVRVTPWFWLCGVLTGYPLLRDRRLDFLLIWIGCLFFSILIHELGHAFAGRMFGWRSDVILYHFGGLAQIHDFGGRTTGRSVVISFAGPWAGFLLYGVVLGVEYFVWRTPRLLNIYVLFAILQLKWINLYWGLINLLPVLPLDGGRISEALLENSRPSDGLVWCLRIGTAVGALAAAVFFWMDYRFPGILFALLAVQNFQQLEQYRSRW
jgi:Zn-dependent protease